MLLPLHDANPLKIVVFQFVTVSFIGACVGIFVWQISLSGNEQVYASYAYGVVPSVLLQQQTLPPEVNALPALLTLISYMFLHGSWMHLLGNMLFLWVFGDNIEDSMGHLRFVVFYLLCGVAAAITHGVMQPGSEIPMIGASGAIAGLLGAYLVLHPRVKILVLLFGRLPLRLPAFLVLVAWLLFQFYSVSAASGDAGVAWWAHIGGFLAGMILIVPMRYRKVPLFDRGVEH